MASSSPTGGHASSIAIRVADITIQVSGRDLTFNIIHHKQDENESGETERDNAASRPTVRIAHQLVTSASTISAVKTTDKPPPPLVAVAGNTAAKVSPSAAAAVLSSIGQKTLADLASSILSSLGRGTVADAASLDYPASRPDVVSLSTLAERLGVVASTDLSDSTTTSNSAVVSPSSPARLSRGTSRSSSKFTSPPLTHCYPMLGVSPLRNEFNSATAIPQSVSLVSTVNSSNGVAFTTAPSSLSLGTSSSSTSSSSSSSSAPLLHPSSTSTASAVLPLNCNILSLISNIGRHRKILPKTSASSSTNESNSVGVQTLPRTSSLSLGTSGCESGRDSYAHIPILYSFNPSVAQSTMDKQGDPDDSPTLDDRPQEVISKSPVIAGTTPTRPENSPTVIETDPVSASDFEVILPVTQDNSLPQAGPSSSTIVSHGPSDDTKDDSEVVATPQTMEPSSAATILKTYLSRTNCHLCDKTFGSKGSLARHLRKHSGEKPYRCTVCDKTYTEAYTLSVHFRTHTGERPYKCDVCGKSFGIVGHFTRHQRTHLARPSFPCQMCDKQFTQAIKLNRHLLTHSATAETTGTTVGTSGTGNTPTSHTHTIHAHKSHAHTSRTRTSHANASHAHTSHAHTNRTHTCYICHKGFPFPSHLVRHLRTHNVEKPYKCTQCGRCYSSAESLTEHQLLHSGKDGSLPGGAGDRPSVGVAVEATNGHCLPNESAECASVDGETVVPADDESSKDVDCVEEEMMEVESMEEDASSLTFHLPPHVSCEELRPFYLPDTEGDPPLPLYSSEGASCADTKRDL